MPSAVARSSIVAAVRRRRAGDHRPRRLPLIKQKQADDRRPGRRSASSESAAGCQAVMTQEGRRQPGPQADGTPINYPRRPAGVRPALPDTRPVRARKFYTTDDRPRSSTWCTTSSTATRCSGTTRPSPKNTDELAGVQGDRREVRGHRSSTDKFIAAPWTAKDGEPFPSGTHVALTHWSVGGRTRPTPTSSRASGSTAASPAAPSSSTFMKEYPYNDSPEPQAM